jgi:hypothetical protein
MVFVLLKCGSRERKARQGYLKTEDTMTFDEVMKTLARLS